MHEKMRPQYAKLDGVVLYGDVHPSHPVSVKFTGCYSRKKPEHFYDRGPIYGGHAWDCRCLTFMQSWEAWYFL